MNSSDLQYPTWYLIVSDVIYPLLLASFGVLLSG